MTLIMTRLFRYAECRYADYRALFTIMLNAITLSVIMLNVITLSVVMLIVVAPFLNHVIKKVLNTFYKN